MIDLFHEYRGIKARDGVAAAAVVKAENIRKLAQITGGIAVSRKVSGGSLVYCEIMLHGQRASVGDYIIADTQRSFFVCPKGLFDSRYTYKGLLRDPVV